MMAPFVRTPAVGCVRWLVAACLISATLGASSHANAQLPPGHPPMGGAPPGMTPSAGPTSFSVRVRRMSSHGAFSPAAGVTVRLERWRTGLGPMSVPKLTDAWLTETDAEGRAVVSASATSSRAPGKQDLSLTVQADGQRYDAPTDDPNVDVVVFTPTDAVDSLSMDVRAEIVVGEGKLFFDQRVHLATRSLARVDLSAGPGIRVPLMLPAAFGDAVDFGLMPAAPNPDRVKFSVTPDVGRLAVERGAVVYQGPVDPGRPVELGVRYPIPYDDALDHTLAFRLPVDSTRTMVGLRYANHVAPGITFRRPHRIVTRALTRGTERVMTATPPPKAGEVVFVDLTRAPGRRATILPFVAAAAGLLVLLFAIGIARHLSKASAQ